MRFLAEQITSHKSLITILVLAALLRFWALGSNPPHLTNDEAALGYNAYSILKTARDEHGEFLPIVFKSFGDWKPGLYVYLTVPFAAALGLTEWVVRLPGAVAGIFGVWLIYLVTTELFEKKSKRLPLFGAFFLAISPWHIQFSRGAWEANLALTFVLAAIYFFLRSLKGEQKLLLLAAALFALTFWTYQGAKLATGIVVLGLVIVFHRELLKMPRVVLTKAVIVGILVALPILISLLQGKTGRLEVYSVFSYPRPQEMVQDILQQTGNSRNSWQYVFYHSEPLNFARGILGRYLNHYSGRFLFFEGDWSNPRHGAPDTGVILILDSLFLVFGLVALARLGVSKPVLFLWFWFLFAPLPAVLSRDSIHAIRAFNLVVPLTIILALGVDFLWQGRKVVGRLLPMILLVFGFLYAANYIYYLDQYWVHAPKRNSEYWQYGYEQMVDKIAALKGRYEEIIIKQDFAQPYIFFLFYQKHDPAEYQKIVKDVFKPSEVGDVGLVSRIDDITFRDINWQDDRGMSGKLFVVDPIKVPIEDSSDPSQFKLVDEIKFLDGQTAFRFLEIL